jgi:Flp pilus assembly protein TadG
MQMKRAKTTGKINRRQRGSVAIEFAIVGVWLIVLLGAIIEAGIFLLIQFELQSAADKSARLLRTNQIPTSTTAGAFKTELCKSVHIQKCTENVYVDVRNATTFAALADVMPVKENEAPKVGPGQSETFNVGAAGSMGSLIVTYDWHFIFPFMTVFGNQPGSVRRLYGISVYRNEP